MHAGGEVLDILNQRSAVRLSHWTVFLSIVHLYLYCLNVECYARSSKRHIELRASEMKGWLQRSAHFYLIPHMEDFLTFQTCSRQPQLTLTQVASLEAI